MSANRPIWKPNVTVAAVLEQGGRFLLVEEHTDLGPMFNQPAGHLEPGESLLEGAVRETLEETAYLFEPTALLGVYQYHHAPKDTTYLRFAFVGKTTSHDAARALDTGIIRAVWLTPEEIRRHGRRHRTPLVMRCIDDHLAGRRFPLDLITHYRNLG
ncbi:MAG: NUDIX hydrolase [Burkholderiales bacterium]